MVWDSKPIQKLIKTVPALSQAGRRSNKINNCSVAPVQLSKMFVLCHFYNRWVKEMSL